MLYNLKQEQRIIYLEKNKTLVRCVDYLKGNISRDELFLIGNETMNH